MFFWLMRTSVDIYNHQENWAPCQSVGVFQRETKDALQTLGSAERLFLGLSQRLDRADTNSQFWQSTIDQVQTGTAKILEERKRLIDQLTDMRYRIESNVLKAELYRRSGDARRELEYLKSVTEMNLEISFDRFLKYCGNVAEQIKVTDIARLDISKPKPAAKKNETISNTRGNTGTTQNNPRTHEVAPERGAEALTQTTSEKQQGEDQGQGQRLYQEQSPGIFKMPPLEIIPRLRKRIESRYGAGRLTRT